MFLTPIQIEQLTGRRKPALQRKWLLEHGYRFEVRADGRPAVLAAAVEARLSGRVTGRVEPNWTSLR